MMGITEFMIAFTPCIVLGSAQRDLARIHDGFVRTPLARGKVF